ncbi:MAG: ATP-grasp domain-containing protein [Bacteroidetes bacterium]|nr:ATP-grasp domain-containing protein [Bacteroidota bacterium]
MKILVLDAGNQNTLAIVRSLGAKGHKIILCGYQRASLSFFSRFAFRKVMLANPKSNENAFISGLLDILRSDRIDLVMPVGFKSYEVCTRHQNEIRQYANLIVTTEQNITLAIDKRATYDLAEKLKIPYPKTFRIQDIATLDTLSLTYPCVIKSAFESGKNEVTYASDLTELKVKFAEMVSRNNFKPEDYPIIQEFITGDGYGFFAYYHQGVCYRSFMHHRIREYPVTGGASVCAESFDDDTLRHLGIRLLDHLKWNGVAMVEFKRNNTTGEYMLMEINPKFWGSLELAISAGVNFPEMLVQETAGEDIPISHTFPYIRFQWVLNGELFHFLERPSALTAIIRDLFRSKTDIRLSDPLPNIYQLFNIFNHYYKKLRS